MVRTHIFWWVLLRKWSTELTTSSTMCFQEVLQLSHWLHILFLLISIWSEKQHFKLDASSSFRSLRRFLGLRIKGCQLSNFKPRFLWCPPTGGQPQSLDFWGSVRGWTVWDQTVGTISAYSRDMDMMITLLYMNHEFGSLFLVTRE